MRGLAGHGTGCWWRISGGSIEFTMYSKMEYVLARGETGNDMGGRWTGKRGGETWIKKARSEGFGLSLILL